MSTLPSPRNGRGATVEDVAGAVGVSPTTVWRALRGSSLVREETRITIVETARELGFEPSRIARALRTQSSLFVGMVVPDVGFSFFASAVSGAQDVLKSAGYDVLLMNSELDAEKETNALRALAAHRVAGILLATSGGFEPCGVPVVFFDQVVAGAGVGQVLLDNQAGMKLLVEHLLEHGHKRIALIGGAQGRTSAEERREAFHAALAHAWLAVPPEYVQVSDLAWSEESGEQAAEKLLQLAIPPTAIIAANDRLAVGALRALKSNGRGVPEDVALVCFDDPAYGDMLDPPLTAISHPARELGASAAELLLSQMTSDAAASEIRITPELIIRHSCGCP